jgi:hypothetical protein
MVFVADDLAAWLVGILAGAGRKKLTTLILGTDQERALWSAATTAVQSTASELRPGDDEQAEQLAMVVSEVFGESAPETPLDGQATVLEELQAGIARQLEVLDDASLTGMGQSSAEVLGVPAEVVATKLTGHLVREIVLRGSRGGPLFPLASQLNHDMTHLQSQRIEAIVDQLADEVRKALGGGNRTHAVTDTQALVELQPGDLKQIGPYRLLAQLGAGAFGEVFLGQSRAGRLVIIKVISATAEPKFRARFAREVDAAQRVSGVFTAPVVDADPDGPLPWLATAYVAGPSLAAAVMDYGPLPVASVLALAAGLAEGLNAIHAAGLVHRDLNPTNVLLATDGPRIIDFGISLTSEATAGLDESISVGTPLYMSPEQAQGHKLGPPSDIFSLGSVLVFAATGATPFRNRGVTELLYDLVHAQADLTGVPMLVRPIVKRCLAKNPQLRPTTDQILAEVGPQRLAEGWLPKNLDRAIYQYALPGAAAATGTLGGGGGSDPRLLTNVEVAKAMAKPRNLAGHAFISYVREDTLQIDQLQWTLEAAGVPVWRDTADLWPGEDWRTKIRRAITNDALVFLACFSQASLARGKSYQNEELTLAIEQLRRRTPDDPWLIPVRLDECEIPDRDIGGGRTLTSIQRADLFGDHYDEGAARLVAVVLRVLGQQTDAATASAENSPGRVVDGASPQFEEVADASAIDALIAFGEGEKIEFKSSLHHPYRTSPGNLQKLPSGQAGKQVQKALHKSIVKTIVAFLNTVGGTLLIGVSDSGAVLGIEPDFDYLRRGKTNTDGWLLSLKGVIVNALGPEVWSAIRVSLVPYGQRTVAVVRCARRTTETWQREEGRERFYIRTSNATQELTGSSILRYIRERWPA